MGRNYSHQYERYAFLERQTLMEGRYGVDIPNKGLAHGSIPGGYERPRGIAVSGRFAGNALQVPGSGTGSCFQAGQSLAIQEGGIRSLDGKTKSEPALASHPTPAESLKVCFAQV